MVNQQFHSLLSSLPTAGLPRALPACQDLLSFSLLNSSLAFSAGPVAYIILSYGHSQPDWCQWSLEWPWEILDPDHQPGYLGHYSATHGHHNSSRSLFWLPFFPLHLSKHGIKIDSCFISILGCPSWSFLCCSILSWWLKEHSSKTLLFW